MGAVVPTAADPGRCISLLVSAPALIRELLSGDVTLGTGPVLGARLPD